MSTVQQTAFEGGTSLAARPRPPFCGVLNQCRVERDGSVAPRLGQAAYSALAVAGSVCYGLTSFNDGGTQRLAAIIGDGGNVPALYIASDPAGPWTTPGGGLATEYASFASMRAGGFEYLLLANGTQFKSYGNSTYANVTAPASGMRFIATFKDRLWAAGSNNVLYASKVGDFNTWAVPDGLVLPIGNADAITGLADGGDRLLVFKKDQTASVDGSGNVDVVVAAGNRATSPSIGCVNHRTIRPVGDAGVMWLSRRGIEFYALGSGQIRSATAAVGSFFHRSEADFNSTPIRANPPLVAVAEVLAGTNTGAHAYYDDVREEYNLSILAREAGGGTVAFGHEVVVNVRTGACYLWTGMSFTRGPTTMFSCYPPNGVLAGLPVARYPITLVLPPLALITPYALEFGATEEAVPAAAPASQPLTGTVRSATLSLPGGANRRQWIRFLRATLRNDTGTDATATLSVSGGNTHARTVPAGASREVEAAVSARTTEPYAELVLPVGVALVSLELEGGLLQRGGL